MKKREKEGGTIHPLFQSRWGWSFCEWRTKLLATSEGHSNPETGGGHFFLIYFFFFLQFFLSFSFFSLFILMSEIFLLPLSSWRERKREVLRIKIHHHEREDDREIEKGKKRGEREKKEVFRRRQPVLQPFFQASTKEMLCITFFFYTSNSLFSFSVLWRFLLFYDSELCLSLVFLCFLFFFFFESHRMGSKKIDESLKQLILTIFSINKYKNIFNNVYEFMIDENFCYFWKIGEMVKIKLAKILESLYSF